MKKELFVIFDTEEGYARKLYEYASSRYSDIYEVMLFSNRQKLTEFMNNNVVKILLAAKEYVNEQDGNQLPEYTICLTENKDEDISESCIYKYKPANEIFRKIMSICAAKEAATSEGRRAKGKCMVIGVYSPVKRCFQTTFSLTLGQILALSGKTLYLNFECFSGFDFFEQGRTNKDILDLLYYSEFNTNAFSYRVGSFAEHIGDMDYIPPVKVFTKYYDVKAEQWIKLITAIREETDYDYLILDLSEVVNDLPKVLMECDRIFTIGDECGIGSSKMAQYEWLLKEYRYEGILDKTEKLTIPVFKEIPIEMDMLPYSELALYIRKSLIFMREKADVGND